MLTLQRPSPLRKAEEFCAFDLDVNQSYLSNNQHSRETEADIFETLDRVPERKAYCQCTKRSGNDGIGVCQEFAKWFSQSGGNGLIVPKNEFDKYLAQSRSDYFATKHRRVIGEIELDVSRTFQVDLKEEHKKQFLHSVRNVALAYIGQDRGECVYVQGLNNVVSIFLFHSGSETITFTLLRNLFLYNGVGANGLDISILKTPMYKCGKMIFR